MVTIVGVVDDIDGDMTSVTIDDGAWISLTDSTGTPWRTFGPAQVLELITHLETAMNEALIAPNDAGASDE